MNTFRNCYSVAAFVASMVVLAAASDTDLVSAVMCEVSAAVIDTLPAAIP